MTTSIKLFVCCIIFCTSPYWGNAQSSVVSEADSLEIIVTQSDSYLMPGDELEISVFQSCQSRYPMEKVLIGGMELPFYKKGIAVFKTTGGSIGLHTIPVNVFFRDAKGNLKENSFDVTYRVGVPSASIAVVKMNVLYIGIDNPIAVATSAGGDEKVQVTISGGEGQIAKIGAGKFNVRVSKLTDDCIISVTVDGKVAATSKFRVRNLPVPYAAVAGHTSGDTVLAKDFIVQAGIGAYLRDFPIDIHYKVTGYNLSIQNEKGEIRSINCQAATFSHEAKQLMAEHLKPGSIVTIGNLVALAPDGIKLKLMPLIYFIR